MSRERKQHKKFDISRKGQVNGFVFSSLKVQ